MRYTQHLSLEDNFQYWKIQKTSFFLLLHYMKQEEP